jgi:hypothetical protein
MPGLWCKQAQSCSPLPRWLYFQAKPFAWLAGPLGLHQLWSHCSHDAFIHVWKVGVTQRWAMTSGPAFGYCFIQKHKDR